MSNKIIEVSNVSFGYNHRDVLSNISISIARGDFVGIIGPNGGGKTTLLKLVLGLLKPHSGYVKICGGDPKRSLKKVGYIPQNVSSNSSFPVSVQDATLMGRLGCSRSWGRYTRNDYSKAQEALVKVGMWESRGERIGELSTGQRQRVFIARSLVSDPEILIMDEPTASIDPAGQTQLFEMLKQINDELTIVIVSHGLNVLLNYVGKVACVNRELFFHDAPHVTSEMLVKTFGFSLDQICPLEDITDSKPPGLHHEGGHSHA